MELVEPQPRAFVFGGGHISKGLSKIASLAGFAVVVVDNREAYANPERFPEADQTIAAEYEEVFPRLEVTENSSIVIVTRGHRDDLRVLRWAIATPAAYVAMIGSQRKVISLVRELEKEGVPAAAFARLHAPMGLEIGAVTPEEIAVSVVAEMIAVRRKAPPEWQSVSKSVQWKRSPQ